MLQQLEEEDAEVSGEVIPKPQGGRPRKHGSGDAKERDRRKKKKQEARKHITAGEQYPALAKPGWKRSTAIAAAELLDSITDGRGLRRAATPRAEYDRPMRLLERLFGRRGDRHARRPEGEYRRPGDEPHVVRVKQSPPRGFRKKIAEFVPVAGVTHRLEDVTAFVEGADREVRLLRETDNPTSSTAIAVLGAWRSTDGEQVTRQLGYLPHEVSQEIARRWPSAELAATLETLYLPRDERSPGIRVDVWTQAVRRRRAQAD